MTYTKFGIASQRYDLSKIVLTLASLGLIVKLLKIDPATLPVLGAVLVGENAKLVAGFIGLGLLYAMVALVVAIWEAVHEQQIYDKTVQTEAAVLVLSKVALVSEGLKGPFSAVVYGLPVILGAFSFHLLWRDSVAVVRMFWSLI